MNAKWLSLLITTLVGSSAFAAPILSDGTEDDWTETDPFADVLIEVVIDIKPGSDPNSINPASQGVVPVAILGSETFDVYDVDPTSLVFAGSGPKEKGNSGRLCSYEDVNADGILDLIAHFPVVDLYFELNVTEASLTASLTDGSCILGVDSVRIVPEPAAVLLLAGGGLALICRRRRA